jgi:hypothetical protein
VLRRRFSMDMPGTASAASTVRRMLLVLAASGGLAACAVDDLDATPRVAITVLPRVILDGTLEFVDRSEGRVVFEAVMAHAPHAQLTSTQEGADDGEADGTQDGTDGPAGLATDVVVTPSDPLLFHYENDAWARSSDVVGGERVWSVPTTGGLLSVTFSPSESGAVDNDPALVHHTAVVHGTIALEPRHTLSAFSLSGSDVSDADPDGAPARPKTGSDVSDADPDGAPARPNTGSDVSDADPDGAPARPKTGSDVSDADPDGAPARPKTGSDVSDADPDGAPARPRSRPLPQRRIEGFRRDLVAVPFTLVIDGTFERNVELSEDDVAGVGEDGVLPIDLRLATSELLDDDALRKLRELAERSVERGESTTTMRIAAPKSALGVEIKSSLQRTDRPVGATGKTIDVRGGRLRDNAEKTDASSPARQ